VVVFTALALGVIARSVVLAALVRGQRNNQGSNENKPRQTKLTSFYPCKDRCAKETDTGCEHTGCSLEWVTITIWSLH